MAGGPRIVEWASVGSVSCEANSFRARVEWADRDGQKQNVRGPRRSVRAHAEKDLDDMRTAATQKQGDRGYNAIGATALRLREAAREARNSGSLEKDCRNGYFRASMHWTSIGAVQELWAPWRSLRKRAQEDLELLRRVRSNATHDSSYTAVRNEVERMTREADGEAGIALRAHLRRGSPLIPQGCEPPNDVSPLSNSGDVDKPFCEEGLDEQPPWENEAFTNPDVHLPLACAPAATDQPDPKDPSEATLRLAAFRPVRSSPAMLKRLLECNADPNVTTPQCDVPPLLNVLTFARSEHVAEMRNLLIQFGAQNTEDIQKRWEISQRAGACEKTWLNIFHADPR